MPSLFERLFGNRLNSPKRLLECQNCKHQYREVREKDGKPVKQEKCPLCGSTSKRVISGV